MVQSMEMKNFHFFISVSPSLFISPSRGCGGMVKTLRESNHHCMGCMGLLSFILLVRY